MNYKVEVEENGKTSFANVSLKDVMEAMLPDYDGNIVAIDAATAKMALCGLSIMNGFPVCDSYTIQRLDLVKGNANYMEITDTVRIVGAFAS